MKMKRQAFGARETALTAVFSAIVIIMLTGVRLSPTGDLFFLIGASVSVAAAGLTGGQVTALLTYLVSSMIAVFYPGWVSAWPFWMFFGVYPLLKPVLERLAGRGAGEGQRRLLGLRLLLKGIYGLLTAILAYVFILKFMPYIFVKARNMLPFAVPAPLFTAGVLLFFVLFFYGYETALSLLLSVVSRRLPDRMKAKDKRSNRREH